MAIQLYKILTQFTRLNFFKNIESVFNFLPYFSSVSKKDRMKKIFPLLFIIVCFACSKKDNSSNTPPPTPPPVTDSFLVTVENGYGSGKYKAGDTVHVFSKEYSASQLFDKWTGDVSLLNAPYEWHTWFVMPEKNVSLTANVKNITPVALQYNKIMGRDRLKPVFYYFPANTQGVVYLLHGTGGNATFLVGNFEWQQLMKTLADAGLGVIVTECEESTTQIDANNDGKIRWSLLPYDTLTNVDYANINILTDTFIQRGLIPASIPRYSVGMSDGGFFSAALSAIYHFKAGVNYCAQSGSYTIQTTTTPIQFCMARYDSNDQVGAAGNAQAQANQQALTARGICSKFLIKEHCPVYPERFARDGSIAVPLSQSIFNELKATHYIDSNNFFIGGADDFLTATQNTPDSFPVFNSLTNTQKYFVKMQLNLSFSEHSMYSDFNHATLEFLKNPCQ